jgi:hypothetical protein
MQMENPVKLNPAKLDLVMRDEDFAIYHDGKLLETPAGNPFVHRNARVLKHLLLKLTLNSGVTGKGINSVNTFIFLNDRIKQGDDYIESNFNTLFDKDFVVNARMKKQPGAFANAENAIEYLAENQDIMNLVFWSNSVIMEGFRSFITSLNDEKAGEDIEILKEHLVKLYMGLGDEEKALLNLLSLYHKNGLLLPMMLIREFITPSEYANSLVTILARQAGKSEKAVQEKNEADFDVQPIELDLQNPKQFIAEVHNDTLKSIEFLRFFTSDQRKISVISELINLGEGDGVEFKSTFRWDIRQGKKNPAIEHASLKTMAAFLNSEGGDLLIGVEDDGNILGVELDNFPNDDKFLLHVWALIKASMGQEVSPYIKTTLEKFDEKTVCRVHCMPSPKPIFLRQKGFDESFYIRTGPSTASLEISEALKYIAARFETRS